MKQYFTGFFTGACLVASAVMFMGAGDKNLGDITVSSIEVKNEDGNVVAYLGQLRNFGYFEINRENGSKGIAATSSYLALYNKDNKQIIGLGGNKSIRQTKRELLTKKGEQPVKPITDYSGLINIYSNGKSTIKLGTSFPNGYGFVKTFNKHEIETAFMGTSPEQDGKIYLKDRYGDIGWSASGKQ